MPSAFSEKLVIIPSKAEIHIQNTAPAPPEEIAVATPTMLPVPTVAARAVASAWNCDMAFSSLVFVTLRSLNCGNRIFNCVAKTAYLKKSRTAREIKTGKQHQYEHRRPPNDAVYLTVDILNKLYKILHSTSECVFIE